ncbi:MAG: hypothetical protein ACTTJW_05375 [Sphaerochaeta sp.]
MINRKKMVLINWGCELGYYVVVMLFGFLAPRLIIKFYGSEVNGLQATITQVINIILLLQSGAATAAIYSLYKPIADSNNDEISKNLSSSVMYFERLAVVFLILMYLVSFVASYVIKTTLNRKLVFIAFIFSGMKSFLDLYYCSKFRILFSANQRKYILSIATLIEQFVYYLLLFLSIYKKQSFFLFNLWFMVGCLFKILFLHFRFKKQYKNQIVIKKSKELPHLMNRNYALANEVSHSISISSITILISLMYGLNEASVFAVYYLVSQALSLISSSLYSAFEPSFANLIASGDDKSAQVIFQAFQLAFVMFNTLLMSCMLYLVTPFAVIYTSNAADIKYENNLIAVLLVMIGTMSAYRIPYNMVVSSCGLFKETWKQPVFTVCITFLISVIFGRIRFELIILGPVIFYFVNFVYQHFKINQIREGFATKKVFFEFLISVCLLVITWFLATKRNFEINTIHCWMISAIVFGLIALAVITISIVIFFKDDVAVIKNLLRK